MTQPRVLNNRYELREPLGQGGMAAVYRGIDTRLGRQVAIKLLHSQYLRDDEFLRRFEHEAQSAAGLSSHPNIVDVYDVGQQDGVPYIVMELVDGSDLKTIIEREGPIPIERTLQIIQQVSDGLDYAHRRGLIHRDIKPQNIMVSPDGSVRITDFGIAKSHLSTAVTQAGMTYGTADYISPEQAQGLPATPQSDVYSLGVVVYEMLTGHLPFTGDSPMGVALQHIQQQSPALRQWVPTLPEALERVVLDALAKDPRRRPPTPRAFAEALQAYRNAQPTVAVPVVPRQGVARQPSNTPYIPQPQMTTPMGTQRPSSNQRTPARRPPPPPVAPPLPRPQQSSGIGLGALVIGLLLLIGLVGIAYVVFSTDLLSSVFAPSGAVVATPTVAEVSPTVGPTGTAVEQVQIPKYIGLQEVVVRGMIEKLGLKWDVLGEPRQDSAPAGTIIEQDPPPDSTVDKGTTVRYRVSLGPPTPLPATPTLTPVPETPTPTTEPTATLPPTPAIVALPNLAGQTYEVAGAALQAAGFDVRRQNQPSQTVPAGRIISQSPQPGPIAPGSTIILVVSAGDVVQFPDVVGLDRAAAVRIVQANPALHLTLIDEQGPDRLPGFANFRPNEVVSATANGAPINNGDYVQRGAQIILGVRQP